MHLGNGAVTPECGVLALGAAAIGAGMAWYSLRNAPERRGQALTVGALGSAVFAAQMFNVQVFAGVSAHLVGGVLLAWIAGPALGVLTMAAILVLQAAVLGDGGLLALGANVVNMAIVPAAAVALVRRWSPAASPRFASIQIGLASVISMVAAAGLIVGEVALFRAPAEVAGLAAFAAQMVTTHALLGVIEGGVTIGLLWLVAGLRISSFEPPQLSQRTASLIGVAALALAVLCLPQFGLASNTPDGYQAALLHANAAGFALGSIELSGQLTGWSALAQAYQDGWQSSLADVQLLASVLSTLLVGGMGWGIVSYSRGARGAISG